MLFLPYLSVETVWRLVAGFLAGTAGIAFWTAHVDRSVKQLSVEDQARLKYPGFLTESAYSGVERCLLGILALVGMSTIMRPQETANGVLWIQTQDSFMHTLALLLTTFLIITCAGSALWHLRKTFDPHRTGLLRQKHVLSFLYRAALVFGSAAFLANLLR